MDTDGLEMGLGNSCLDRLIHRRRTLLAALPNSGRSWRQTGQMDGGFGRDHPRGRDMRA